MRSIGELRSTLSKVDRRKYPELSGCTRDEIWRGMGPGGLYLVSLLVRELFLAPGSMVLDLGCGTAVSSLFLAETCGARVVAADLWADAAGNAARIESRGQRGKGP
jgi:SAM-dependent methyltransferase